MRAYQRGSRGRSFRRKPPMQWVCSTAGYNPNLQSLGATGSLTGFELVGSTPAASFDPPVIDRYTVLRVRGQINIRWTPSAAAQNCLLSMGIIRTQQKAGPLTVLPNPSLTSDGGSDWLWLTSVLYTTAANFDPSNPVTTPGFFDIDVKSKRVMREGDALYLITLPGFSGTAVDMLCNLRTLIARVA